MNFPITVQGRCLQRDDVALLVSLIDSTPQWGRYKLSLHIAELWHWTNAAGQLKDTAARSMLRKLDEPGLIRLPPRKRAPPHSKTPGASSNPCFMPPSLSSKHSRDCGRLIFNWSRPALNAISLPISYTLTIT